MAWRIANSDKIPIQIAVVVPSTKKFSVPISESEMHKRTAQVRAYLSNLFGGYTDVAGKGGYMMGKKLIAEDVKVVTAFASREDYFAKRNMLVSYIREKGRRWGQDSMGLIIENDFHLIYSKKQIKN